MIEPLNPLMHIKEQIFGCQVVKNPFDWWVSSPHPPPPTPQPSLNKLQSMETKTLLITIY